jgi:hypothetical protein
MNLVKNKLRVLHYPQVPCKPFEVIVKDEHEAKKILDTLINQHCFLYENNFILDYSNALVVEMYDEAINDEDNKPFGWSSYYNDDECMDWDEFAEKYLT